MLGDLAFLLQNVILQVDREDRWLWTLESSHVFSIRSVYNVLTSQPPIELLIGPQVHGNIGFSIKDVESHRDQCQVPLSIVTLFI